jgi:sugar lactone lactonase YvrE
VTAHQLVAPWTDRLELGEGGRWVGDRYVLVDILAGRLLEGIEGIADSDRLHELRRLSGPLGAVAPVAGTPQAWIAAADTGIALLLANGTEAWLGRPEDANPHTARMNDGCADPSGRFWAGSMAYDSSVGAGALYRVSSDCVVEKVLDGLTVPNGPAFTPDGRCMYLADSALGTVGRYPLDPESGSLGEPVLFLNPDSGYGTPDGMTVDAEGNVWIAFWGSGIVRRFRPDGMLDAAVDVPASQPTSVCLGGPSGRHLYVSTAGYGLPSDDSSSDGKVFIVEVDIPGPPAAEFIAG